MRYLDDEEANAGLDFLESNKGAYEIQVSYGHDGEISLQLVRHDCALGDMFIRNLDMSGIYAQCAPSRIIHDLEILAENAVDFSREIVKDIRSITNTTTIAPINAPF